MVARAILASRAMPASRALRDMGFTVNLEKINETLEKINANIEKLNENIEKILTQQSSPGMTYLEQIVQERAEERAETKRKGFWEPAPETWGNPPGCDLRCDPLHVILDSSPWIPTIEEAAGKAGIRVPELGTMFQTWDAGNSLVCKAYTDVAPYGEFVKYLPAKQRFVAGKASVVPIPLGSSRCSDSPSFEWGIAVKVHSHSHCIHMGDMEINGLWVNVTKGAKRFAYIVD